MSHNNICDKLLQDYDSDDNEDVNLNQLEQDYKSVFQVSAKQFHNIPSTDNYNVDKNVIQISDNNVQSNNQQNQFNEKQQPSNPTNNQQRHIQHQSSYQGQSLPSILKKKSSYDQSSNLIQGQFGFEAQNLQKSQGEQLVGSRDNRDSQDIEKSQQSPLNQQVRFGRKQEKKFSIQDEVLKLDRVESINQQNQKIEEEDQKIQDQDEPGSVDQEMLNRSEMDYWKGELPLDLFLESTYENGQRTNLDALTVYRPDVEPILYQSKTKNIESYLYFDEKSYDYQASVKDGRRRNMLRRINENDGFLGFYSQNKRSDVLKMLICVTMYSESREFLENTLYHIYQNQKGFLQIGLKDFQICVVVIQDGIMKMKEESVDFYTEIEGEIRDPKRNLKIRRFDIQSQLDYFKFNNQQSLIDANEGLPPTIPKRIALTYQNRLYFVKENHKNRYEKPKVYSSNCRGYSNNQIGMTVFSVFKHKNAKKLSSHMWFFEGFCRQFNPKYCALVDVGTLPAPDGLLKFYMAMEGNSRIGGVCGFLGLEDPPEYKSKENQVVEGNVSLDEEIKQKKENLRLNTKWWNIWQSKKQQQSSNQNNDNIDEVQQQDIQKIELQKKKDSHFKKKIISTTIFSFFFFLPIQIIYFTLYLIYFILFKCVFKCIFKILKWISYNYLSGLASLKKAQLYEYTMAHMLDKNFESLLGFLHVLPGAWSAYRYKALEIKLSQRQNLLQKRYFKQLINPDQLEGNIQEANMFLAEDRILCLGIYCQPDSNFILKYIPDAQAFTDPVETLEEFMNQRRRWINSTLYALDYVLKHFSFHVQESSHSSFSKYILLPFNMLFAKIGKLNTYFIPAFYMFVAITSSFQLISPEIKKGYMFRTTENYSDDDGCIIGMEEPQQDDLCSSQNKEFCYIVCEEKDFPSYLLLLFDIVPAIYIICFLLIVFASLTFRIKRVNRLAVFEELSRTLLTSEQKQEVQKKEDEIKQQQKVLRESLQLSSKQIKQANKKINEAEKKLKEYIIKITKKSFKEMEQKIQQHQVKLTPKEKLFKEKYDTLTSQDFSNSSFKILSAIMSFISIIVMIIVTFAILMNIFNDNFGLVKSFVKLEYWLRLYVIIMACLNTGSFFILLFVHLLFQPKLVWYIIISYWSYTIYQPIYNFTLIIFSFCNIDDVTWGTKGISSEATSQLFYQSKVKFLLKWFSANALLLMVMICGNIFSGKTPYIILLIGMYGTLYLTVKTILAIFNYIKYFVIDKWIAYCRIRRFKNKNKVQQQEIENKFKDFLKKIESSKTKSHNEWRELYNNNKTISQDYIQKFITSPKSHS
ncbi:chitin synthase (macronuclear) [Tetrahymena thermophila SB210]|uniref:chitin synthase n=1 Tax=Tetrahymena thermophila (strain SB210) TaxID=312017 RepID=I7MGU1_TETTS|nr:chitin synthase [Tetrahymena thermophila SB210]EAR85461.1 chitin synthase [Tetrahymena thermophila SB210]|eukprot:XP_001033124.1 chitin synthase [Tetrahymena thermophila SB210]